MRVEIVSMQAAVAGRESIVWIGEIAEAEFGLVHTVEDGGLSDRACRVVNERLFRLFNRVDDEDGPRLEAIGYRLPSLSVGDLLVWGAQTWRVAGSGFDRVTGDADYVVALALYALRSAAEAD
jgi:hypothetical protein